MILQNISRWATDASEFVSEKCSQIRQKMTVLGLSRPLGCTKLGYEENTCHLTLESKFCELCLWSHVDTTEQTSVCWSWSPTAINPEQCGCVIGGLGEQSLCNPIFMNSDTNLIKAGWCGSRGTAVRAVFMILNFHLRKYDCQSLNLELL